MPDLSLPPESTTGLLCLTGMPHCRYWLSDTFWETRASDTETSFLQNATGEDLSFLLSLLQAINSLLQDVPHDLADAVRFFGETIFSTPDSTAIMESLRQKDLNHKTIVELLLKNIDIISRKLRGEMGSLSDDDKNAITVDPKPALPTLEGNEGAP